MDVIYKILVESNLDTIKNNFSPGESTINQLYSLNLINKDQYDKIAKSSREEALDIFFKLLSKSDVAGRKYKSFVEDFLQRDYEFVYVQLQEKLSDANWREERYKEVRNFGDFPRRPANYVERTDKIIQVQNSLKNLSPIGKVILCGMTGSGKSSLAMGMMTPDMVLDVFGGKVFWISVGDVDDEQIIRLLLKFYLKLCDEDIQDHTSLSTSSIDILKDKLKKKIRENSSNTYMLLILDNVCSENVVNAFDIGCKILITTQSRDIWTNDIDTEFIEVNGSFKIEETMKLFANCLGRSVEYVWKIPEAQKIHDLCQGHPFSIALFGSQIKTYKESLLNNGSGRWKQFVQMLEKNYKNQQDSVIDSCIESLSDALQSKFSDLAIFPEDVNISSKVLEIMWDLKEYDVINIMGQLENKSLIVSYYSIHHQMYIFGIHVVLLTYLKSKYKNELKSKHVRLISAYRKQCNDDFSRLNDDNYIYQYIGYHLNRADFIKDFKIYFDLKFLGAKLKATGIGDILKDFNIYRKQIQDQTIGNDKSIVQDLESFIKNFGDDLHKHEDVNIIQCALKYSKDSFIYRTAMEIATSETSSLYFKIKLLPQHHNNYIDEFTLPENCTYVCFGKDEYQLLLGTKEGVIEIWDRTYRKVLSKYIGHTQSIRYIELDPEGVSFLSVSDDGFINSFTFCDNMDSLRQKPSLAQNDHWKFFGEKVTKKPTYTFKPEENDHYITACFSNDYKRNKLILTGSNKGVITIWKNFERSFGLNIKDPSIRSLKFSLNDSLIMGTSGQELFLLHTNLELGPFRIVETPIKTILPIDEDSFVTVSENVVSMWSLVSKKMPKDKIPEVRETVIMRSDEKFEISCAFVDYQDRLYVVSTGAKVIVYDLGSLKVINALEMETNDHVTSSDVIEIDTKDSLFLLKYGNNILKFYTTNTATVNRPKQKPIYDCYWPETQARLINASIDNTIQISNNFNIVNDVKSINSSITVLTFAPTGDIFVCGLENGQVIEYGIKTNQSRLIMKLNGAILHLKMFSGNDKTILVVNSKNGDLMVRQDGLNTCLISQSPYSQFSPEPLAEIFYVEEHLSLLTISKDRTIKLWNLKCESAIVLKAPKNYHVRHKVLTAAVNADHTLLVVTMANMFDIFMINKDENQLNLIDFGGDELENDLYSCAFSYDNRYLAIGSKNGAVIIYDVNVETRRFYEFTILYSHISAVKDIIFSPCNHSILVTVAEQMVWWNLNKLPEKSITRNRHSRRNRHKIRRLDSELEMSMRNLFTSNMTQKNGTDKKPHLLRAIKLKGSYANTIHASPNFKSFVTKDDEGICYIVEMIE